MRSFMLLLLAACGGSTAPAEAPRPADHGAPAAPAVDHAAMGHRAPDHMVKMAATRDALRAELKEAYDAPVAGLDSADRTKGKALFDEHCVSCHGATGKGDGPGAAGLEPIPSDFTDTFHAKYYSDAGRLQLVRKGSPGTAMAGFEGKLSEPQLLEVYAYVRTLREPPPRP